MTFSCTQVFQTQEASPFIGSPSKFLCVCGNSCKLNGTLNFCAVYDTLYASSFLNVTLQE